MLRGGLSCASSVTRGCSHSILRSMNERELGVSFQLDELEALKTPQTTLTTQPPSPLHPVTSTADLLVGYGAERSSHPYLTRHRRWRRQPGIRARLRLVAAEPRVDQQSQLVEAGRVQPALGGT